MGRGRGAKGAGTAASARSKNDKASAKTGTGSIKLAPKGGPKAVRRVEEEDGMYLQLCE